MSKIGEVLYIIFAPILLGLLALACVALIVGIVVKFPIVFGVAAIALSVWVIGVLVGASLGL